MLQSPGESGEQEAETRWSPSYHSWGMHVNGNEIT